MHHSHQNLGQTGQGMGWHYGIRCYLHLAVFHLPPLPLVVAPCHFCCLPTDIYLGPHPILAVCSFATLNISVHTEAYAFCIEFSLGTVILVQFHTINNLVTHQPNCL